MFTCSGDDSEDSHVLGEIVREMPNAIVLIQHNLFERLEAACKEAGVELVAHHFDGTLQTQYGRSHDNIVDARAVSSP